LPPPLSSAVTSLATALTTTLPALVTALQPTALTAFTSTQASLNFWMTAIDNAEGPINVGLFYNIDPVSIKQRADDIASAANALATGSA
jgi:hypothetical protein